MEYCEMQLKATDKSVAINNTAEDAVCTMFDLLCNFIKWKFNEPYRVEI